MTAIESREAAQNTLEATRCVIDALNDHHKALQTLKDAGRHVSHEHRLIRKVGEAQDAIRQGFKFAEVNALLYVGDQLGRVVDALQAQQFTADEIAAVEQNTIPKLARYIPPCREGSKEHKIAADGMTCIRCHTEFPPGAIASTAPEIPTVRRGRLA